MYRVFKAPNFDKTANKILSFSEKEQLQKKIEKLKQGEIIGKSLSYDFFRELKIGSKRVYFLRYAGKFRLSLFGL